MNLIKKINLWQIAGTLSIVGVILASYLLYSFYNPKPNLICDINDKVNCQAITSGTLATFANIPVSLVGLIGYAVILFSALTKRKKLMLGMSTFGMLFCLRLTILEVFFVKILCPVCIACQTVMLLVFVISIVVNLKRKSGKS